MPGAGFWGGRPESRTFGPLCGVRSVRLDVQFGPSGRSRDDTQANVACPAAFTSDFSRGVTLPSRKARSGQELAPSPRSSVTAYWASRQERLPPCLAKLARSRTRARTPAAGSLLSRPDRIRRREARLKQRAESVQSPNG
jgi:hypothetical protein